MGAVAWEHKYTNIGVNGGPGLRNFLDSLTFTRGYRIYELTNHLGNVVTTITDRKWGTPVGASGSAISYYDADVNTATDYFPLGMPMVGRVHISYGQFYRFGFNGKMNDDDVKGYFKQQDYGMRVYDPRVGRFLSVDPLTAEYPFYTPYQHSGNNPIRFIDLDGLEESDPIPAAYFNYQTKIDMTKAPESSPRNAEGIQRNAWWYWKQMQEAHPEMFDVDNIARIKAGSLPIVNEQWIKYNKSHASFNKQKLHHHHVDQSNMDVAIPKEIHEKWTSILHNKYVKGNTGINGVSKIKSSISSMNKALGIAGIFLDAKGAYQGDPHSQWIQLDQIVGKAKMGQVYFDDKSETYVVATSMSEWDNPPTSGIHKNWKRVVHVEQFADYAWDAENRKYVGVGLLSKGYQIYYKDGSHKNVETANYRNEVEQ